MAAAFGCASGVPGAFVQLENDDPNEMGWLFCAENIPRRLIGLLPSLGSGNRESIERRTIVNLYLPFKLYW